MTLGKENDTKENPRVVGQRKNCKEKEIENRNRRQIEEKKLRHKLVNPRTFRKSLFIDDNEGDREHNLVRQPNIQPLEGENCP